MVEFTVLSLYHEIRSLNSELETKEYWNYRRYFERETIQILYDGYCSGVETLLLGIYDSSVSIKVVLEYLSKIRYSCSRLERVFLCVVIFLRRQTLITFSL
jgi:hypothetical protein